MLSSHGFLFVKPSRHFQPQALMHLGNSGFSHTGSGSGDGSGAGGPSDERNPWALRAGGWPPNEDLAGGAAAYAGAGAGVGAGRVGWLPKLSRKDAAVLGRVADGAAAVARLGLAAAVVVGRDGLYVGAAA